MPSLDRRKEALPVQSRTPVKPAAPTERTKDGLPVSWGSISQLKVRRDLDSFVKHVDPEKRHFGGFDPGQVCPIAGYASVYAPTMPDSRAEAMFTYSRRTLDRLKSRANQAASHLNTNLARQVEMDRYPLVQPPTPRPPPPPPVPETRAQQTARLAERRQLPRGRRSASHSRVKDQSASSSRVDGYPPYLIILDSPPPPPPPPPLVPPIPVKAPVVDLWLHILKVVHPVATETRNYFKVARNAEIQGVAQDLVRLFKGGRQRKTAAELAEQCWVFFVGEETQAAKDDRGSGSSSAAVILRQFAVELRAERMPAFFARVPEHGTSQHCPHPNCMDETGKRSK